jgi:DNA-binding response OmpR family regulator
MKILIAEDEADTLRLLKVYFSAKNHQVIEAENGLEALELFKHERPQLVLLDIMMPGLSGWRVLKDIRAESGVPVIVLTALDNTDDAIRGLELGADDYLRKPFQLDELDARINAVLRRTQGGNEEYRLRFGPCSIDDRTKRVTFHGREVSLSPKEYELLKLLAEDAGRVFSNNEIIARLWPDSIRADHNDVKQYIHLLRSKIETDPSRPDWIRTVKGFGYKFEV